MLLSGENGAGKSALAGRWLRSLEPKAYFPVCITQASLTGIGLLALFLQKLGKAPMQKRSASLKLLEEAFGELGRIIPVLLLDEAQNYAVSIPGSRLTRRSRACAVRKSNPTSNTSCAKSGLNVPALNRRPSNF